MSSYQSVPKPWSSASSTGRTWAPIRAPISRSSAPTATSSNTADALAKSPSLMSALPVATAPTRLESSTHESSVGPRIVQQEEEPHSYQHHKNNNQLQTSLFGELDSILGRHIHKLFFFGKIKYWYEVHYTGQRKNNITRYLRCLRNYGNSDFNLCWSINQCPNPLWASKVTQKIDWMHGYLAWSWYILVLAVLGQAEDMFQCSRLCLLCVWTHSQVA